MEDIFKAQDGATTLEPDEKEGLKFALSTRAELNELEQANIEAGLRWLARQKKPLVLSEAFIRQLHVKLFADVWKWAGQFRTSDKNIGVHWPTISVELRKLLDDTSYWINNETYPPLEIAIRFHHRLVQIHLFPNGNGRHARIMAEELFEKTLKQTQKIKWYNEEQGIDNKRREQYLVALRAAGKRDYTLLLEFFSNRRS